MTLQRIVWGGHPRMIVEVYPSTTLTALWIILEWVTTWVKVVRSFIPSGTLRWLG